MKNRAAIAVTGIMLLATQALAANGDLLVDGNVGIGTTAPGNRLTIGDNITGGIYSGYQDIKLRINDAPAQTSGGQASLYIVNQPNVAGNSSAYNYGTEVEVFTPATSNKNYGGLTGGDYLVDHNGSGVLAQQIALTVRALNHGSGAITYQYGINSIANLKPSATGGVSNQYSGILQANNNSVATVNNQYGSYAIASNYSTGSVTTQYATSSRGLNWSTGSVGTTYGVYADVLNRSTGTITTAYGLAVGNAAIPAISNLSGTVTTGYGIYLGAVQATNKWSLYAADVSAPSYFAGNVGIGTATPAFALDVQGTIGSNNSPVLTSDARYKTNLAPINSSIDKVKELSGYSYEWKTGEYPEKHFQQGRHYGVIAQEIEKVLPEVVNTAPDGTKAVAYTEIIPVLIEAIKEQQKQIDELKKLIK